MLTGPHVADGMAKALENTQGDLAEKLDAARPATMPGGDRRGQSTSVLVVRNGGGSSPDAGNRDDLVERFEFTGGLEDFASEEGSADAGNIDEAGSNAPPIEAFPSESSPSRAPWRSPEEVAEARVAHDDRFQQVDSLGHPTGDSAVGWDTAPVYAPSGDDIGATESELSTAATRPPLYRYRRLTMAASALLLFAAVTAILAVNFFRPADGSGVYTSTPPQPATSAPVIAPTPPMWNIGRSIIMQSSAVM